MKLSAILAANAAFAAKSVRGPVAVFVGGTSGLGEAAMKKFAALTTEPKIYFVGRNAAAAAQISADLQKINPGAQASFIQTNDLSSLHNALAVANRIKTQESKLNLLVLSQGYSSFSGHDPTPDGIERRLAVTYYSRFLLVRSLLPLLLQGVGGELGARVVSICAPGNEGRIVEDDLPLAQAKNFSLAQASAQGTSMNSLAMEHLAETHPSVGFLHVYPGPVMTGLQRNMPMLLKPTLPLIARIANPVADVGEGLGWLCTDERWRKGLGLVDWRGEDRDARRAKPPPLRRILGSSEGWWREGLGKLVWEHGGALEERVLGAKI